MTTAKIAISVPEDVLERAREAVRRGRGASLSAFVSAAIDQKLVQDELDGMLDEMLAEAGGPLTPRELARARKALGVEAPPSKKPKKRAGR